VDLVGIESAGAVDEEDVIVVGLVAHASSSAEPAIAIKENTDSFLRNIRRLIHRRFGLSLKGLLILFDADI